jgi:hypothetical protein
MIKNLFWLCFVLMVSLRAAEPQKHSAHQPADGVYLSFDEVRANKPSLLRQHLFRSLYDTNFTILQWSRTPSLFYINSEGQKISLQRQSIIMIAEGGTAYIQQNGAFHKASLFGPVTLFTESYPKLKEPMAVAVTEVKASSRDRLLDIENETVMDYTLTNFLKILKRDEELYHEFQQIPGNRQKRKMVYRYIEKYNERNKFSKP